MVSIGAIILQLFVIAAFIYQLVKCKFDLVSVVILFLSYQRIFEYYGKGAQNIYKIIALALVLLVFLYHRSWRVHQGQDVWFTFAFIIFVVQFLIACFLYSSGTINLVFAQLARYVEFYLMYFVVKQEVFVRGKRDDLLKLFYDLFLVNILFSVIKWLILRIQYEGLVGTFAIQGGGYGTSLPIIGFIILWLYRRGNFSWKDWLYTLGLLWLGFTTGKRAVMFILPLVVLVFMTYVKGVKINKYMGLGLLALPILFYLGVRLTPSLNPDNRVWGRFDLEYAFDYAEQYQFGSEGMEGQMEVLQGEQQMHYNAGTYGVGNERIEAEGRGGATVALIKLIFSGKLSEQDLWGMGFSNMYGTSYEDFDKLPLTIHVNHKGSATGIFQSYVTTGVLGVFTTIIFCFMVFFFCKPFRMRMVLLGIVAWDYLFYSGFMFRTPALLIMYVLIIYYVNYDYLLARRAHRRQPTT